MDQASKWRQHVTGRWLEYEGELRAAVLRASLIVAFYLVQLVHYLGYSSQDEAAVQFHRQATYLTAAWLFASLAVLVMLSRQYLPSALKYATSFTDVVLLTMMAFAGSGPASPLVMAYLLLIVMAGLRGSLKLIWSTTLACAAGYIVLVVMQRGEIQSAAPVGQVRPIEWMVALLSIASTGVVTGQLVRMLRQVVSEVCIRQLTAPANEPMRNDMAG
jgi:hypothetical protein